MYYRDKLMGLTGHGELDVPLCSLFTSEVSVLCTLISVVNFLEVSVILRGFRIWLYLYFFVVLVKFSRTKSSVRKAVQCVYYLAHILYVVYKLHA